MTAFGEDGLCSVALFSFVYSYLVHFNINISVFNYTMLIFVPQCIHSFSNAPFSRFKKKNNTSCSFVAFVSIIHSHHIVIFIIFIFVTASFISFTKLAKWNGCVDAPFSGRKKKE